MSGRRKRNKGIGSCNSIITIFIYGVLLFYFGFLIAIIVGFAYLSFIVLRWMAKIIFRFLAWFLHSIFCSIKNMLGHIKSRNIDNEGNREFVYKIYTTSQKYKYDNFDTFVERFARESNALIEHREEMEAYEKYFSKARNANIDNPSTQINYSNNDFNQFILNCNIYIKEKDQMEQYKEYFENKISNKNNNENTDEEWKIDFDIDFGEIYVELLNQKYKANANIVDYNKISDKEVEVTICFENENAFQDIVDCGEVFDLYMGKYSHEVKMIAVNKFVLTVKQN